MCIPCTDRNVYSTHRKAFDTVNDGTRKTKPESATTLVLDCGLR